MLKYFLLIFFIISTNSLASKTNEVSLEIALYGLDKNTASDKTVKKILLKIFQKIDELENIKVNAFFYKDEKKLINDFISEEKKFDILYTVPLTYLKNYETFNKYGKDFIILRNHNKYVQYYLIKNKKLKIKSLKGMKNKKLITPSSDELSRIWLDSLFLKETNKPYTFYIKNEKQDFKMYKKVLDVYFNKTDFVIVPKHIWDTTIELNPKITNKLEIFRKSKPIFPGIIGAFHRKVDEKFINTYNSFIIDPNNEEYMQNILNLVKLYGVEIMNKNDYSKALDFYLDYEKMIKKVK